MGVLSLAVTLDDVLNGLLIVIMFVVILVFSFNSFPPLPNFGIDFFLEGSLIPRHFSLPASRKIAGI